MTSTMSELREALEEALQQSDKASILAHIEAFKQFKRAKRKSAVVTLLEVVRQNEIDPQYDEALIDTVLYYEDVAMPELLMSLLDSSNAARRVAYNTIKQSEVANKQPDVLHQLLVFRDHIPEHELIRYAKISEAVEQLKAGDKTMFFTVYDDLKNPEPKHIPHLLELLKSHIEDRNVATALSAIIASSGFVALPYLIRELYTEEESSITGRVIDTLAQIASPFALPTLETITVPEEFEENVDIAISIIDPVRKVDVITNNQTPTLGQVNFTSYCPPAIEINAKKQHHIITYAYLGDFIEKVEEDIVHFKSELGGTIPSQTPARFNALIPDRTKITVIPECNGITFETDELTKSWNQQDGWLRFNFVFRSPEELLVDNLIIRMSIRIYGIEISHIKHEVTISKPLVSDRKSDDIRSNPLAEAKKEQVSTNVYNKIFISYSRQDRKIAQIYRLAQMALGNDVFMDTYDIRTGENWRAALAHAIDSSDVFQLFWSENSAKSENVKDEWDYALRFCCLATDCSTFIRPVYWHKPMPPTPTELSHINFRFVPFEDTM